MVQRSGLEGRVPTIRDEIFLKDLIWVKDKILQQSDLEEWSSASLTNVLQACSFLGSESAFEDLEQLALEKVASNCFTLSNAEYVTILSCMVHMNASTTRASALCSMEAALSFSPTAHSGMQGHPKLVVEKGLDGFDNRDFGHLSWALTELQCSAHIAELVFGHAFGSRGEQNLTMSSLCLLCRMISIRGSHQTKAEENLDAILRCLEKNEVLRRLSSLRDSTMMLLSISRLTRSACDKEGCSGDSIHSGLKWTMGVVSYRKSRPSMGHIVDMLCSHILRALESDGADADHSVYSSILYSLALLQYRKSTDIIETCLQGLEDNKDALTLRSIGTCSWSMSVLRYEDARIMHVFATRIIDAGLIKKYDKKDISQAISMILYSFSVLNVFKDKEFEPFLVELMGAAETCMSQMAPESLPIFGWSIMVSHSRSNLIQGSVFEKTMRRWRSEVADNLSEIPRATLPLVHHTEIALALESPTLGLEMYESFESNINLMYASGRVKRYAMREWNTQQASMQGNDLDQQILLDGISLFQKQVFQAAERVCSGWMMEYWDDKLQYPVDMALPIRKIVIEADGPTHFTCNTKRPLGATALKRRLLQKLGWNLVVVPYYEWNAHASIEEQYTYMSKKLDPILKETQNISVRKTELQVKQTNPENHGAIESQHVKENASKLDIIHARKGKISLNEAMKRQIFRKNVSTD